MQTVLSTQIGQLTQDKTFRGSWRSEKIAIPLFDNKLLTIVFTDYDPKDDIKFIEDADRALSEFLQLDKEDRLNISEIVFTEYSAFLEAVDEDEYRLEMTTIDDVWNCVHPIDILVTRRPYHDMDIYVQVHCNCDWEEEHGIQLVFRQGRQLTRVSGIDGHLTEADAYDKPDSEDELLSRFK